MPVPGCRLRTCLAASIPSRWKVGGIRISVTTTWGAACSAPVTSPSSSLAPPTTSMSAALPLRARTPSLTIRLSSARNTGIFWAGMRLLERSRPVWSREAATRSLGVLTRRRIWAMRIESSVTSVSWIPSEAIGGFKRAPFDLGPMHYDDPPADQIDDVQALARSGAVRFINQQRAWVEVDNGSIVGHGQSGRGWMGRTKLGFCSRMILYPKNRIPDLRPEPGSA